VAGGETAGIPFAAWIAERMGLPMVYVRKKPKGFGRDARIEGAPVGPRFRGEVGQPKAVVVVSVGYYGNVSAVVLRAAA